jgi:hypothetical protein
MSSPKRAAPKPASKSKPAAKPAVKTKAAAKAPVAKTAAIKSAGLKPAAAANTNDAVTSGDATRVAAEMERALAGGKLDTLSPQALHALMSACCKTYAQRVEAGEDLLPLAQRTTVSPTEVMVTASGLLRAANLAVFELGMWQSWTGR